VVLHSKAPFMCRTHLGPGVFKCIWEGLRYVLVSIFCHLSFFTEHSMRDRRRDRTRLAQDERLVHLSDWPRSGNSIPMPLLAAGGNRSRNTQCVACLTALIWEMCSHDSENEITRKEALPRQLPVGPGPVIVYMTTYSCKSELALSRRQRW
jgi:hypothetical protein